MKNVHDLLVTSGVADSKITDCSWRLQTTSFSSYKKVCPDSPIDLKVMSCDAHQVVKVALKPCSKTSYGYTRLFYCMTTSKT